MRFIKEISNTFCKTSLYSFNNKFILKFEAGLLEQAYKVSELDVSQQELEQLLNDDFFQGVVSRFEAMQQDFSKVLGDF